RYHHKDGSTITVFCKGEVVEWAEDGTPIRMIGTHTDLTQFKKAEEQLRLLQLAVDHSKDLVLVTEPNVDNPIIVYASKASKEMCGYEPEELIGQTPSILQGKKTDRTQLDALKNALKKQEPFIPELINYAKDGREYWTNLSIVPVKDAQGNTTHFAAIKHDVTKKKAAEAEREKLIRALELSNKELDEFAYVASHDLKAPLRVIDNASRWLEQDLEEYLNDDTRESMELLRNRVSRMEKLLDDLLEYSRIGRKVDGSYGEIISGDALGKDIVQLLSPPKSFSVQFSPEFNSIKLPRMPLQHVLLNLISNAIKHHDKDKGSIEVNIRDEGSRYVFTVTDDGPGIAPEFQEQVFNMFQTLKPRDQVEGSGMGLAMVKKHIEHFGGTITLESEEGQGATFRFIWPKEQLQVNQ
ncbi:MAG: ATP-binding protein, partial [Gammaproteobacteria bacterium]